ncbi:MAG: DUF2478 domain-containing protein [Pseudomonadota bacterium]
MSEQMLFGLCREEGPRVDDLLRAMAGGLRARGLPVAGYVQERLSAPDCSCPGILLHDLATGVAHDISEKRGPGASGCNLDWAALTERAADLERAVAACAPALVPALVIVSRFGKAEAEGRGFCGVIETCMERSVPVLVAYRTGFAEAWAGYHGGLAMELDGRDAAALLRGVGMAGEDAGTQDQGGEAVRIGDQRSQVR